MRSWTLFSVFWTLGYVAFAHQQPALLLPVGHNDYVRSARFSPDGKFVVTASNDLTAKIWEVSSGKLLQDLKGHTERVNLAQFSPDGKYIVTTSDDNTVKIWTVASGEMLQNFTHQYSVLSAEFSPDGRYIVMFKSIYLDGGTNHEIWDVASGKLLKELPTNNSSLWSAKFSPDGKYFVTASELGMLKIWDVSSGKLVENLKGHSDDVSSAQFSPDGKYIVTGLEDGTAKIWRVASGEILHDLKGHIDAVSSAQFSPNGKYIVTASNDNTAKIWEVSSGKLLHNLTGHTAEVSSAQFSPDGKHIVTSSRDSTAKIWEVASGEMLHELKQHGGEVWSAEFSPDGKYIVTTFSDETAKIWEISSGKLLQDLKGHTNEVEIAQFSPDGKYIVSASNDNTAKIWEVSSGKLLHNLTGHTAEISSAQFSPYGKYIVSASYDETAKIWEVSTGKLLQDLKGHKGTFYSVRFSPDGKYIVSASWDKTAKIWEVSSGKLLQDLKGHTEEVISAQFSPDGKYIVSASWDKTAKIWEVASGKLLQDLKGHKETFYSVRFSPDGKHVITASFDNTTKIWEVSSGEMLQDLKLEELDNIVNSVQLSFDGKYIVTTFEDREDVALFRDKIERRRHMEEEWLSESEKLLPSKRNSITLFSPPNIRNGATGKLLHQLIGHTSQVPSAQFSPDGKYIVSASDDGTAKIWEASTGKLLQDLKGHTNWVTSAQFSPDGKSILTTSLDHKTMLWDVATGKMRYARLQINNNDWLVYDEHYRYDGSPGARDYLYFVCGLEIVDLAQMKDALYVPGLAEKIMNGEEINYPRLSELDICEALPLIEKLDADQHAYRYKITQRKLGLHHVEVYINDKKVYTISINELKSEGNTYFLELAEDKITRHFKEGAENKVEVIGIVLNSRGNELKSRGVELIFSTEEKPVNLPKLFAVMVGVNEYKDPALKLNYPVKDAIDLGSALEASASRLLGKENVFLYPIHTGVKGSNGYTTPEKEGIRRALEDIGKKSKPEDVILMFFAGHGVMQGAEEKLFTFLTAEASTYNLTGIHTKELQQWLSYEGPNKILANKTILIFDACNSGQATKELMALARDDEDSRRIRQVEDLKDKSGTFILAASAPNQSAYELPQYEQGLLTYSLLSVLKNNPDVLDDGAFLNVQKWFLESEKYLKELVRSHGYQQDAQPFGTANIRIGVVDEGVRASIVLAKEKPLILCANVLNSETYNDDIQLKNLINEKLAVISERGNGSQVVYARLETPGANKINISYDLKGDQILCRVRLVKGGETLHQTEVKGTKAGISELAQSIIKNVVDYAR
jgi:WD40 repeat protein